jgi:ribosomal protein S18 acetylase RimI-like enzyme
VLAEGNVVLFRTFRNADPPALVELWNKVFTGRGAVYLRNSSPLERLIFSKPFFDPAGLFLAFDQQACVGFAHAGMALPGDASSTLGAVCMIGVHPDFRRRGIGAELLRRAEEYLRARGATTLYGGGRRPANPFYLGLYGGCDSPGWLKSDPLAEPFLLRHGYRVQENILVFQKEFEPDQEYKCADPRFGPLRQYLRVCVGAPHHLADYYQECTLGSVDPLAFTLVDERTGKTVARTLVWEMENYKYRWGRSAVGIVEFDVDPDYRRKGVGKFLLNCVLRQMQEQFVDLAEIQLSETDQFSIPFLQKMGFEVVDHGQVFVK